MKRVGGKLDYRVLAELNKPTEPEVLASEVRGLAGKGLTAVDISTALRIDLAQVRSMLAATAQEGAAIHREHAGVARGARDAS